MVLRLYDTGAKQEREFVPHRAGTASMYVCGATVQGPVHLGHLRSAVVYDVLRRWLTCGGLDVLFVRNVTDVEDKILAAAADAGRPWWEWAAAHERAFDAAYRAVGCLPPSISPRATGHVPQMIELMHCLIDGDHAYAVPGGDVYFDVHSYPDYGGLSGQRLEQIRPGDPGPGGTGKRDARDFTLWKAARPGEPSWPSPWGRGRPAWRLECSAMSTAYLGAEFDIHGGGRDLLFPHHESERAQSRSAGDGFARYWTHNALITAAGEKNVEIDRQHGVRRRAPAPRRGRSAPLLPDGAALPVGDRVLGPGPGRGRCGVRAHRVVPAPADRTTRDGATGQGSSEGTRRGPRRRPSRPRRPLPRSTASCATATRPWTGAMRELHPRQGPRCARWPTCSASTR